MTKRLLHWRTTRQFCTRSRASRQQKARAWRARRRGLGAPPLAPAAAHPPPPAALRPHHSRPDRPEPSSRRSDRHEPSTRVETSRHGAPRTLSRGGCCRAPALRCRLVLRCLRRPPARQGSRSSCQYGCCTMQTPDGKNDLRPQETKAVHRREKVHCSYDRPGRPSQQPWHRSVAEPEVHLGREGCLGPGEVSHAVAREAVMPKLIRSNDRKLRQNFLTLLVRTSRSRLLLCTHVGGLEVERGVVGPVLSWRAAAPVAVLQRSSNTQQESQELRTSSGQRSSDWRMACLQHVPNGRLLRPVRARPPVHQRVVRDEDRPRRALQQPAALPVRLDQVGGRQEMRTGQHLQ